MNPLSATYAAAIAVRNSLYDRGTFRPRRLQRPVVSVGNISVGGTGKTPFIIALGELLKQRGIQFDVLSRGYRRSTTGVRIVDPRGTSEGFGDEPLLIARKLEVPVIVGESRYQAGCMAEQRFTTQLHLLDDGFQHRQLARSLDIVLLAREDLDSTLLPFGRLREPLSALRRANVLVFSDDFDTAPLPPLQPGQLIWRIRRQMQIAHAPSNPLAFCGIAKPGQFFAQLRSSGVHPAAEVRFRDHHRYTHHDILRLQHSARAANANGFVTTAKDEINLSAFRSQLQPLAVAELILEFENPQQVLDSLLSRLAHT